jgi:hypothetical protein
MLKTAIYVDFDNIYGGILDKLGIPASPNASRQVTAFQVAFLKEVLVRFFRKLKESLAFVGEYSVNTSSHNPLCIKVFAEYENLPLSQRFSPSMTAFLHNAGVVPINPFVAYSKKKENRNAADVALVLTAIEDLLVKRIPAETVVICTCDIDLYPLILWLKEHTGKEILLAGFSDRTNRLYDSVLVGKRVSLDWYLTESVIDAVSILRNAEKFRSWISEVSRLTETDIGFILRLKEKLNLNEWGLGFEDVARNLAVVVYEREQIDVNVCEKFKKKLISGLKNWLKSHDFASTGLVINSWLPKWNLEIDVVQANECLKQIVNNAEELKEKGISFVLEKEEEGLISGKFFKLGGNDG